MSAKSDRCRGCRNDFYNEPGNSLKGECWSLNAARVVTRYRIGWWTRPDSPGAFTKVRVLDCYHQTGQNAYQDRLPEFAVEARKDLS